MEAFFITTINLLRDLAVTLLCRSTVNLRIKDLQTWKSMESENKSCNLELSSERFIAESDGRWKTSEALN